MYYTSVLKLAIIIQNSVYRKNSKKRKKEKNLKEVELSWSTDFIPRA